jgi:1-acyl-sn-glycerol-3-phosphate acyltransferase
VCHGWRLPDETRGDDGRASGYLPGMQPKGSRAKRVEQLWQQARRAGASGQRGDWTGLPLWVAGDPPLYKFARLLLVSGARLYGRVEVRGAAHLPASGPALVVCNHPSDIDPILLAISFPRTLYFMADEVQFRRGFVGRCIRRLAAFPVNKEHSDTAALRQALRLLAASQVVALFPEGDMYEDDRIHPFERGVGFLAVHSGAPIVPVAITGSYGVHDARWRRWPTIRVLIGEPIGRAVVADAGREAYAQITARVEQAVSELRERGLAEVTSS